MTYEMADQGWHALLFRLTVFPPGPLPGAEDLWRRLTGRDPDINEIRKREGLQRQAGPHEEGELDVRVSLGRIDVLMTPLVTNVPTPAIDFGLFEPQCKAFLDLVHPWLNNMGGDINRIAFGGALAYPAKDRTEAYALLGRYVPSLKVDVANTKEVLYRVNRPLDGKSGVLINRITTWSAIRLAVHVGTSPEQTLKVSEQHFLRLEFDHNTAAERTEPLERTRVAPIFEELVDLVSENATRGECP